MIYYHYFCTYINKWENFNEIRVILQTSKVEFDFAYPGQKIKIMASGPITSWQINRETMATVTDFISLGSKITADGEIKRCLLLGRKVMINLDRMFTSRDIALPTKSV